MGRLDGRIAIVTGAGRGLGREHALFLAKHGAKVVVNDLGGSVHGEGSDRTPAQQVVNDIMKMGGEAVVSGHDVSDWQQAAEMIQLAVDSFGDLNVLVNNAGILRDRTLANMSEEEWDAVIRVHLKGHAAPTKHAVAYWRGQSKQGVPVNASVIHTSSVAGYAGNFGQANYSSAKLAIAALSSVVVLEASRYGVRSNVVSPGARTRLSLSVPGADQDPNMALPDESNGFDGLHPANVSPLIGWLADANCPANGQMYHTDSNRVIVTSLPPVIHKLYTEGQWTLEALDKAMEGKLIEPTNVRDWFE